MSLVVDEKQVERKTIECPMTEDFSRAQSETNEDHPQRLYVVHVDVIFEAAFDPTESATAAAKYQC